MNAIKSFMSKTYNRGKYKVIKHGPAIAIVTGLVGMGASVYLTYKATTKIEAAKAERENNMKLVEGYLEAGCITDETGKVTDIYSHEDAERDKKIYKSRYIMTCAKYLALPTFIFVLSGGLIGFGAKTYAARLATAGTTIAGLIAQNNELKKDLEDAVGPEKANDILLGKHTTTETELKEDGSVETKQKTTTNRFVYGKTFEFSKESSPVLYSGILERDRQFIEGCQNRANWLMNEKKGFVTFADVLEEMEVPMDGCGYVLDTGSVETPGHTIIFDIDERLSDDDKTYFIITVNFQGYIRDKI